jgi:beta-1,4-N-acetylglucosaminyltransferase
MIFVTIGTTEPFDRLLAAVGELDDPELVVQCGDGSIRPEQATCVTYLTYDELVEHVRGARLIVSHAGVGTILTALANGKRPLVVPRLKQFGEAVDDHQVELAGRLAKLGLVTLVEDPRELAAAVATAGKGAAAPTSRAAKGGLVADLGAYLAAEIGRHARQPDACGRLADRVADPLAEPGPR